MGPSASCNGDDPHAAATAAECNSGMEEMTLQSSAVADDRGPKTASLKGGNGCDRTDLSHAGCGRDVRSTNPVHIFVMGHRCVNRIPRREIAWIVTSEIWGCSVSDHPVLWLDMASELVLLAAAVQAPLASSISVATQPAVSAHSVPGRPVRQHGAGDTPYPCSDPRFNQFIASNLCSGIIHITGQFNVLSGSISSGSSLSKR